MPATITRTPEGVEEKLKWSCEGCIKGHRSSSCSHWDRWMVKVTRPGRPSAKCTHAVKPCPCKSLDKYLMVAVYKNAEGECICKPIRAGQPPEQSTLSVPPIGEDSVPHSRDQEKTGLGENAINNVHMDVVAGNNDSVYETRGTPVTGYHPYAAIASRPREMNYQRMYHQFSHPSQGWPPPSHNYALWNPTQAFPAQPLPLRPQQALQLLHGESSPISDDCCGNTTSPLSEGLAPRYFSEPDPYDSFNTDQTLTSTSDPGQSSGWQSHPYLSTEAQSAGNQQASTLEDGAAIVSNIDFGLSTPMSVCSNQRPAEGLQQGHHAASPFPGSELFGTVTPSYDFTNFTEDDFDPKLASRPDERQDEMHHTTNDSDGRCQCGPDCNCLRCTTHPGNPATTEWAQNLYDIMDEDDNGRSAPRSRPQSSYGQPYSESQSGGPEILKEYAFYSYSLNTCSRNADCCCGDNCRCTGCLTHSGHIKL